MRVKIAFVTFSELNEFLVDISHDKIVVTLSIPPTISAYDQKDFFFIFQSCVCMIYG